MDQTKVSLGAAVRALTDVVAPAIDAENAQVKEQLQLAIDTIEFVMARLDYLYDREIYELRHHIDMARCLQDILSRNDLPQATDLTLQSEDAELVLSTPAMPLERLRASSSALTGAISVVVNKAAQFDPSVREQVERSVVNSSKPLIEFERSWYGPLGFDPEPGEIRSLEELLRA